MSGPAEVEQLRRDRDRTRAELGRSVEALSERLDLATRTRDRMHRAAHSAQDNAQRAGARAQENAIPLAIGAATLLTIVWVVRRARSA